MNAQDIMVQEVICVDIDARLPEVKALMEQNSFHHLPVTEEGLLVGIISDRDLLRTISPFIDSLSEQPRDLETLNHAAHQVMTRQPITAKASSPISEIVTWMKHVDISCVPVVDEENHLLGMITWRDLITHAKF
ncbi:CBS domain-containing protein [Marinomonas pollencensis]|uniref:Acetoin utilization protein AcuB n=1 Tax=Marinomonas pollencensis TaxID=491954 RepID=A0A3E0DQA1_9GAMM|nr:CBS domain-containing protein [Marinomonas pollencensis]REG85136.1 acetoin utilization protein AcuB [Marinomonas pollencensis]